MPLTNAHKYEADWDQHWKTIPSVTAKEEIPAHIASFHSMQM
jgi:hypothetical protein